MPNPQLLRTLMPEGPLHKRTERDLTPEAERRAKSAALMQPKAVGVTKPRLTSTYAGSIDAILLALPRYALRADFVAAYRSLISALRPGTEFVIVHTASLRPTIEPWFSAAGHPPDKVTFVAMPDYISFTDWAEDGYVSVADADDNTSYLIEPWEFPRSGDRLIAEAVHSSTSIRIGQAPLIFQGGNCLIGDDFWLIGKDYVADSVALVTERGTPIQIPGTEAPESFVVQLFTEFLDSERRLISVGTTRAIPLRAFYGTGEGGAFFLDIASDGVGTFQPIFHIDMFITLIGKSSGSFEVLVGSPAMADAMLGRSSPLALADVYDTIAAQLSDEGFKVQRNPLVHEPTEGRVFALSELKELAVRPENGELGPAIDELAAAGASDPTRVTARSWHHITWNNCLVENSPSLGKHVYLPTFGHGSRAALKVIDDEMRRVWEALGFTVHALGDFNGFAERQGVVHCIKKYLRRGN
jgi:hypothetical protein